MYMHKIDFKRARGSKAKEQRRSAILKAAAELFSQSPTVLPTTAQIGKKAEIAKGTLYLYFRSKETIFLALLEEYYLGWFNSLSQSLDPDTPAVEQVIEQACSFIEQQPLFFPLASLSSTVIEQNIDQKTLMAYKNDLSLALRGCAKVLAQKLAPLTEDEATQLVMRSYAMLLGLWQISHPANRLAKVINTPSLSGLQPDFHSHSRESLKHLWHGVLQHHQPQKNDNGWRSWFS